MLPCVPRRVVIAQHRVDYRKQWNGLLAECYHMGFNPYEGDCVVFIKRDRTQLRALAGDRLGLVMISRRFEGGSLKLAWVFGAERRTHPITLPELTLLLDGAVCTIDRQVPPWQ
jgi:hypothetical protein